MHETSQQAAAAVATLKELDAVLRQFVEHAKTPSDNWRPDLGSIAATPSGITCYCLGRKITAEPRPVALLGRVRALEFAFTTSWLDGELPLLHLYLQTNAEWTRDLEGEHPFRAHQDPRFKDDLVQTLCVALLASPLFAPATDAPLGEAARVVNLGTAPPVRHVQAVR